MTILKRNEFIPQNYTKAYEYYKKVHKYAVNEKSILGHAYYNTAYMHFTGNGTVHNTTKFESMLNLSLKYEPSLHIPITLARSYAFIVGSDFDALYENILKFVSMTYSPVFVFTAAFVMIFYIIFIISLKLQI